MTRRVAAFDFDGTLTRRDTLAPFLVRTYGRRRVVSALAVAGPPWRATPEIHRRDDVKAKLLARLTRGHEAEAFTAAGRGYAEALGQALDPEMVATLEEHRQSGHEIVLVSASLATYLDPFAREHLAADHVIAVEMEVGPDGCLTGALAAPNVRAAEKERRLRAWLGDGDVELWAYGNSSGDTELLAMADHPTWVRR